MFHLFAPVVDVCVVSVDVQHSGYAGLLGTPGNLGLRKRTGVSRLNANNVGFASLVRVVDADLTCDASGHDVLRADRIQGSL